MTRDDGTPADSPPTLAPRACPPPRYRVVPHTADFAMEVDAPDFAGLVQACLLALSDAGWGLETLTPTEDATFEVAPGDAEMQLFQAMAEALFLGDARDLLIARAAVMVLPDGGLRVDLACDRADPARHRPRARFKAVTLHGMHVRATDQGLTVRVILDV